MKITVCAFTDNQPNSVAYKKFEDIDKAVEFYKKQLERDDVNVISTRKVKDFRLQDVLNDPAMEVKVGLFTDDQNLFPNEEAIDFNHGVFATIAYIKHILR